MNTNNTNRALEPTPDEIYISVDVEASGPIPGRYSLLSLGACLVSNVEEAFYLELQPISDDYVPDALMVSGLSLKQLRIMGTPPADAMRAFLDWIRRVAGEMRPVFVGFNGSFDWSFVNWYFHTYFGENPFGIGGIDIKAYFMGLRGCTWHDTSSSQLPAEFQPAHPLTHNALEDARSQAGIFAKLLMAPRTY